MEREIIILTGENFKDMINQEVPVLVDFWAAWCGPCRMIAPIVESIAKEYSEMLRVAKLNVDDCGEISEEYGIMSIPTLILFRKGEIVGKLIGLQTKDSLVKWISNTI